MAAAIPPGTRVVVHLAAVVSAQAEADFDLGLKVNLHGTLAVLAACRALAAPPRVVFTSSVASFGGGQAAVLPDDARQVPEQQLRRARRRWASCCSRMRAGAAWSTR